MHHTNAEPPPPSGPPQPLPRHTKPSWDELKHISFLAKAVAEEHRAAKEGTDYRDFVGTGLVAGKYVCSICRTEKEAEWPCKPYRWAVRYLTDGFMETLKAFSER